MVFVYVTGGLEQETLTVFKSYIVSKFYYCHVTWHFCNQASTNEMKKIKEGALIFIVNDFSSPFSPRASNTFHQVAEAKRFEGVFLCRKVCRIQKLKLLKKKIGWYTKVLCATEYPGVGNFSN